MALTEEKVAEYREIFDHYDADSNGIIDRDEFLNLLRALDEEMTEAELDVGLTAVDENRNGKIEFREFLAWWSDR